MENNYAKSVKSNIFHNLPIGKHICLACQVSCLEFSDKEPPGLENHGLV